MSLAYLSQEIIQPGKSFKKFECWSNKAFKKYDVIQIMTSLFFTSINPRNITRRFSRTLMRWIRNRKSNSISYSWYFLKWFCFKTIWFCLFSYFFADSVHFYKRSIQEVNMAHHMCRLFETSSFPMSSLSIIISHTAWWCPFSFHIWSAIPDFSISPRITAYLPLCDKVRIIDFSRASLWIQNKWDLMKLLLLYIY